MCGLLPSSGAVWTWAQVRGRVSSGRVPTRSDKTTYTWIHFPSLALSNAVACSRVRDLLGRPGLPSGTATNSATLRVARPRLCACAMDRRRTESSSRSELVASTSAFSSSQSSSVSASSTRTLAAPRDG